VYWPTLKARQVSARAESRAWSVAKPPPKPPHRRLCTLALAWHTLAGNYGDCYAFEHHRLFRILQPYIGRLLDVCLWRYRLPYIKNRIPGSAFNPRPILPRGMIGPFLRRGLLAVRGDITAFFTRPISAALVIVLLFIIYRGFVAPVIRAHRARKNAAK